MIVRMSSSSTYCLSGFVDTKRCVHAQPAGMADIDRLQDSGHPEAIGPRPAAQQEGGAPSVEEDPGSRPPVMQESSTEPAPQQALNFVAGEAEASAQPSQEDGAGEKPEVGQVVSAAAPEMTGDVAEPLKQAGDSSTPPVTEKEDKAAAQG